MEKIKLRGLSTISFYANDHEKAKKLVQRNFRNGTIF